MATAGGVLKFEHYLLYEQSLNYINWQMCRRHE